MLTYDSQQLEVQHNLGSQYTRHQLSRLMTRASGRVLDVGSQTGDNLMPFEGCALFAFDLEFTAEASRRKPGISFTTAGATAIPFKDDSFDVVLMNHVLEHIPDEDGALREAQRVLRKGGLLWLACPSSPSGRLKPGERERHGHVRGYSRHSLAAAATRYFRVRAVYNPGRILWSYHHIMSPLLVYLNLVQMKLAHDHRLLWQRSWLTAFVNPLLRAVYFPLEDVVAPLAWWPADEVCAMNTIVVAVKDDPRAAGAQGRSEPAATAPDVRHRSGG